jgi:hypothetical protein
VKRFVWIALAVMLVCFNPATTSCFFTEEHEPLECKVIELKKNLFSQYYDAIIRVECFTLHHAAKSRFTLITPTNSYELETLTFIEEGNDSVELESGDIFIVPLSKPDWKFYIREQNEIYCSVDFWELIPEADRWHPLKSEAMEVARSIEVTKVEGELKLVPKFLPLEWALVEEEHPMPVGKCGTLIFQKTRVEEVKEEVRIEYCKLTSEEKEALEAVSETDFLTDWTEWTRKFSQPGLTAGHNAVYWDMRGYGNFGWSYRYAYVDDDTLIEVTVDSDPLEWVKTEQEKEEERRTRRVLVTYVYGPVGEPGWTITIAIRANGEGSFDKLSRGGVSITKLFALTESELDEIERALLDNNFLGLESLSGPPGGTSSSMTVRYDDISHTVEMRDDTMQSYNNIAQKIQDIVLPKVGETF